MTPKHLMQLKCWPMLAIATAALTWPVTAFGQCST